MNLQSLNLLCWTVRLRWILELCFCLVDVQSSAKLSSAPACRAASLRGGNRDLDLERKAALGLRLNGAQKLFTPSAYGDGAR